MEQIKESKEEFEALCKWYATEKKSLKVLNNAFNKETEVINKEIGLLQTKKNKLYTEKYQGMSEDIEKRLIDRTKLIINSFPAEKTVKFEGIGRFTKKILKSIEVVDKDKLLNALVEKKMLSKGVKSFDTNFLKKSKELGLFSDEEVKSIEKPSLLFVEENKDVKL